MGHTQTCLSALDRRRCTRLRASGSRNGAYAQQALSAPRWSAQPDLHWIPVRPSTQLVLEWACHPGSSDSTPLRSAACDRPRDGRRRPIVLGRIADQRGHEVWGSALILCVLGSDDDRVPRRLQGFPDELLLACGPTELGRVEEGHRPVHRSGPDHVDHLRPVGGESAVAAVMLMHPSPMADTSSPDVPSVRSLVLQPTVRDAPVAVRVRLASAVRRFPARALQLASGDSIRGCALLRSSGRLCLRPARP